MAIRHFDQVPTHEKGYDDSGYFEGSEKRSTREYKLSWEAQKGLSGKRDEDHKIPDTLIEQAVRKASKQLMRKQNGERVAKDYKILGEGFDDNPNILHIVLTKTAQAPVVLTVFRRDNLRYVQEKRMTMTEYQALLRELPHVDVRKA